MTTEFGYYFHPSQHEGLPGHSQLDINIYAEPTGQHFDPERVTLSVSDSGDISTVTITHPWSGEKQMSLCTGRILIHDRHDKVVEGFTLGGEIEITGQGDVTTCQITSAAPIIHLIEGQDIATTLVSEFEALLAKRRAVWLDKRGEFEKRLVDADPYQLFVAGLATIKKDLDQTSNELRNERHRQATHVIDETIRIVKQNGNWPEPTPALSDLL